jgi:TatD DNase family protein
VIDTHAHLDAGARPAGELVARARAAGVERIVTIGSGIPSCRKSLEICDRETEVVAALGIHPHQAGETTPADVDELRALLGHPKAVAVGETGLDYYRDYAPRPRQLELFRLHATLAVELGKPLVVHTRAADTETLGVLDEIELPVVVLHCFSAPALLAPAIDRDYYVSFAGNVTYPKAVDLRLAAADVPTERLLAETDAPYLAPQTVRGRPNEPANVVHVHAALARARGDDAGGLETQIECNARRAFRLP